MLVKTKDLKVVRTQLFTHNTRGLQIDIIKFREMHEVMLITWFGSKQISVEDPIS